jgi:CxxC motif-containing protein
VDAEWDYTELLNLDRSQCKLAWDYVRSEIFDPRRMVTTTVLVEGSDLPLVSVKTDTAVPKEMMIQVMDHLAGVVVQAPIDVGDVIIENVLGTGSNIVATRKAVKTA